MQGYALFVHPLISLHLHVLHTARRAPALSFAWIRPAVRMSLAHMDGSVRLQKGCQHSVPGTMFLQRRTHPGYK